MKKYLWLLAIALIVFFTCRSLLCEVLYPEMRTVTGEWDGANNLTMDLFAWMFFLSFLISRVLSVNIGLNVLLDILISYSASDVIDRLFGQRQTTAFDLIFFILGISFVVFDYIRQTRKL